MAIVRLLGHGIGYSASPQMHAAAFAALGLGHRYELADVEPDGLPAAVAALRAGDILGANVTVPHKAAVAGLLDELDATAAAAGAVNTILKRDGRLVGSNTDVPAMADEIERLAGAPRRTLILGKGGAARGVASALASIGAAEPVMLSRADWPRLTAELAAADLLVNATPVGTDSDSSPVAASELHPGLAVLDLVYRPSPTRLVHDARARGIDARAGAGVLLGQGWRSLAAWLGVTIAVDVKRAMADALAAELGEGVDV